MVALDRSSAIRTGLTVLRRLRTARIRIQPSLESLAAGLCPCWVDTDWFPVERPDLLAAGTLCRASFGRLPTTGAQLCQGRAGCVPLLARHAWCAWIRDGDQRGARKFRGGCAKSLRDVESPAGECGLLGTREGSGVRIVRTMDADVRTAVGRSHLHALTPGVIDGLLAGAVRTKVPAGSVTHREGESAPHLELVISGVVRVFVTAPDGRSMTVRYCRAGALLGRSLCSRPGSPCRPRCRRWSTPSCSS